VRGGLLLCLVLLAGCDLGGGRESAQEPASPTQSETDAAPSASQRTLRFASCDGAFVPQRSFLGAGWRRRSTRVGPVRFLNMARLAKPGLAGRETFMVRALFPPSRAITIGVDGEARSRVGFLQIGQPRWSGSRSDLYSSVVIEDCPEHPPELGELPAGRLHAFVLSVGARRDGCVPLVVTRDAGRVHRRVVSFGGGVCGPRQ
jgi:hypothetical protein